MLPEIFQEHYSLLRQQLTQLSAAVEARSMAPQQLTTEVSQLQSFFGEQVLLLPFADLDAADFARTQSYNTELHKQLRLLATDAMFLGSARQEATIDRRNRQLSDRLATLVRYCDVLLDDPQE